ncbi:GGDEF domain-containing protein [Sphingobacterium yanglingense]|uniref:diguanylate cyclase n=1 Tax=Sphingobacterium yanglingense TaxID=1437280 RepID=A0A4V3DDX8_9SPHI|nr:GGDEF domain-containing protein [Sphingobacterium yanglingense]TDQ78338.1 diguanylate cyclase (GGDEF)-like protein [Sphingobacterium yanglingense]
MKHIRKSFEKFKSELLSKGFYDIFKAVLIFAVGLFSTYLISLLPLVKTFLFADVIIPIYLIVALTLFIISLSFLLFRYKSRLDNLIRDNNLDELTGLKNHKALKILLESLIKDFKDNTSIILIDIDDFKSFNTKYGYGEADLILKKLGELLGSDKRATDETFRFFQRGDEFIVVARETNLGQALQAAERKRIMVENNIFSIADNKHRLTICCGATILKKDDSIESLTDRISKALKEAKGIEGKNNTKSIS